jgi:membrane-associated protease RseP (regulator of RpoE activity)
MGWGILMTSEERPVPNNNSSHIDKVRKAMELFTLGVAILTAASFLFAKIGVWVPLTIAAIGPAMGWIMLIVLVVGGFFVACAALYVLVVAYGELLNQAWQKTALCLTAAVIGCMVVGVIVEGNYTALRTAADIQEVLSKR